MNKITILFIFVQLILNLVLESNAYFITVDETKFHLVKSYLCRYGYMNDNVCKQHADDSLKFMQNNARDIYRGLVIFQTMFNITRSGKIDEDTILKMAKPRCGNKDFDMQFSSSKFLSFRTNDFSLLRKSLSKLTYSIRKYHQYLNKYSKSVPNDAVEGIVEQAFNTWLKHLHGDVRVGKVNEYEALNSNITIYFAEGNHGDSMLFDGIDGELAHSCSLSNTQSPFRGHIHLDDSENWNKGNRLLKVLMHQIGHLFGLDHSSNPKSIMSPLFYFGNEDELLEEDVRNLRMILGLEAKYKTNPYSSTQTTTVQVPNTNATTIPTTSTKFTSTTTTSTTTVSPTTSLDDFGQVLSILNELKNVSSAHNDSNKIDTNKKVTAPEKVIGTEKTGPSGIYEILKATTKPNTVQDNDLDAKFIDDLARESLMSTTTTMTTPTISTTTSTIEEQLLSQTSEEFTKNNSSYEISSSDDEEYYELLKIIGATSTTNEPPNDVAILNVGFQTKHLKPSSKHQDLNEDNDYIVEESIKQTTETSQLKEDNESTVPNKFADFTDELVFPAFSKEGTLTLLPNTTKSTSENDSDSDSDSEERVTVAATTSTETANYNTTEPATISYMSYEAPQYEDLSEESLVENNEEYLITLTTQKTTPESPTTITTTTTKTTTLSTSTTTFAKSQTNNIGQSKQYTKEASSEKDIDLCNDPEIDDITRTEWGNAFIFKGNYVWHVRGLTKWRLFDYEGWPRKISSLFPLLPGNIDATYLYDDHYHFTKNQTLWKYKIILTYPPKYVLVTGYPRNLKEEYPDIPFKSVDSAFSIASSIFFFKDYEFWQSDWNTNLTGKIPFKANAAVSWRNPRLDSSMTEPLAYIVSNSSMYKFNFWSIPISQETLDIRYFLFDCVQANYKPHNPLFLGPSYKQAFIADDVYMRNFPRSPRLVIRQAPETGGEFLVTNNSSPSSSNTSTQAQPIDSVQSRLYSSMNHALSVYDYHLFVYLFLNFLIFLIF